LIETRCNNDKELVKNDRTRIKNRIKALNFKASLYSSDACKMYKTTKDFSQIKEFFKIDFK